MLICALGARRALRVVARTLVVVWMLLSWAAPVLAQSIPSPPIFAPPNTAPAPISRSALPVSYGAPIDKSPWSLEDATRNALLVQVVVPIKPGDWTAIKTATTPIALGLPTGVPSWNLAIAGRDKLPIAYGLPLSGAHALLPSEFSSRPIVYGKPIDNTGPDLPGPDGP